MSQIYFTGVAVGSMCIWISLHRQNTLHFPKCILLF